MSSCPDGDDGGDDDDDDRDNATIWLVVVALMMSTSEDCGEYGYACKALPHHPEYSRDTATVKGGHSAWVPQDWELTPIKELLEKPGSNSVLCNYRRELGDWEKGSFGKNAPCEHNDLTSVPSNPEKARHRGKCLSPQH